MLDPKLDLNSIDSLLLDTLDSCQINIPDCGWCDFFHCFLWNNDIDEIIKMSDVIMATKTNYQCLQTVERYKCKKCVFSSNFLVDSKKHKKICPLPDDVAKSGQFETSGVNVKTVPIKRHECTQCGVILSTRTNLKKHLLIHLPKSQRLECSQCDYKTKRKDSLQSHVILNHGPYDKKKCRQYKSTVKGKGRRCLKDVNYTQKASSQAKWFECEQCDFKYNNKTHFKRHVINIHTPHNKIKWYQCAHCDYKGKMKGDLESHMKFHSTITEYECATCEFKTKFKYSLRRHNTSVHTPFDQIKWFQCAQCERKFRLKSGLKEHMGTHLPKNHTNLHKCALCDFGTNRRPRLRKHLQAVHHFDIEWFQCEHCHYKTLIKYKLRQHTYLNHSSVNQIKWFDCEQCQYKARTRRGLNVHLKKIHKEIG